MAGKNGEGKSTIGEMVTWCLYGCDTFGSQMIKGLSPVPTNYDYDSVETHLLIEVNGTPYLLSRAIENDTVKYYINEVPKKAKEYESFVADLFDKKLFLSLFTPSFYFSQKWEEQRAQLLSYVLAPANSEVLKHLPTPQSDKLSELLKKSNINDLEAKHRDNKNKKDKALIAAKSRVETLKERLATTKQFTDSELKNLDDELQAINEKLDSSKDVLAKAKERDSKIERMKNQMKLSYNEAQSVKERHAALKAQEIEGTCNTCGQPLAEESLSHAHDSKQKQLNELRDKYTILVEQYNRMKKEFAELEPIEAPETAELMELKYSIEQSLRDAAALTTLASDVEEAKQAEKETHESYTESVFILDAIKAFKAKEAEIMAGKVSDLFTTLSLKLFETNKGDGEQKPYFEIEMDGKPYRKLSVGEKIKAGLELIQVLSKQSGTIAPCLVDNAESYTSAVETLGQIIVCMAVPGQSLTITDIQ